MGTSSLQPPALEIHELRKTYRSGGSVVEALRGISFTVPKGVVFTILGPNGAGKTTLLRILTTISRPTSGQAWVQGVNVWQDPLHARQQIGVVFQNNHFNRYLSVWDNLVLHARMHGLAATQYVPLLNDKLQAAELYERRYARPEQLSGGQQRKVALIRAVLHQPSVLFLDEPTTGLDPQARQDLWGVIETLKQRDTTVILTTHYMDEAERLSDEVLMMQHGQKVLQGAPDDIKLTTGQQNLYEYRFTAPYAEHYRDLFAQTGLVSRQWVQSPHVLQVVCPAREAFVALLHRIEPDHVAAAQEVRPSLEAIFLSLASQKGGLPGASTVANTPELPTASPASLQQDAASNPGQASASGSAPEGLKRRYGWPQLFFQRGILPTWWKVVRVELDGWPMEVVTAVVSPLTFFLAFGLGLRGFMSEVDGLPYMVFLVPGLISYTILLQSFSIGAWALWLDRWHQGMIDEARIKPITTTDIILGNILGAFVVSVVKGSIVALFMWWLTPLQFHPGAMVPYFMYLFPGSIIFTCLGTIAGTLFRKPDNIAQTMTIIVTPLLYLGGLFFPISVFPNAVERYVHWLPTTAIFQGGREALVNGLVDPFYLAVVWVFAAFMLMLSVRVFNDKLSE